MRARLRSLLLAHAAAPRASVCAYAHSRSVRRRSPPPPPSPPSPTSPTSHKTCVIAACCRASADFCALTLTRANKSVCSLARFFACLRTLHHLFILLRACFLLLLIAFIFFDNRQYKILSFQADNKHFCSSIPPEKSQFEAQSSIQQVDFASDKLHDYFVDRKQGQIRAPDLDAIETTAINEPQTLGTLAAVSHQQPQPQPSRSIVAAVAQPAARHQIIDASASARPSSRSENLLHADYLQQPQQQQQQQQQQPSPSQQQLSPQVAVATTTSAAASAVSSSSLLAPPPDPPNVVSVQASKRAKLLCAQCAQKRQTHVCALLFFLSKHARCVHNDKKKGRAFY